MKHQPHLFPSSIRETKRHLFYKMLWLKQILRGACYKGAGMNQRREKNKMCMGNTHTPSGNKVQIGFFRINVTKKGTRSPVLVSFERVKYM